MQLVDCHLNHLRKPDFCLCENKGADQHLCFRYMDSTVPLLCKSIISSLQSSSVLVQPGLCRSWSETPKSGFLTTWLISFRAMAIMKARLKGAQKGHSLLKKKSDALTMRFRLILKKIIEVGSQGFILLIGISFHVEAKKAIYM